MSAPSWAIFFKDNEPEMINQCFINTGWYFDEAYVLNQIKEYLDSNDFEYDFFRAYGKDYRIKRDEIAGKIVELQVKEREERRASIEKLRNK